MVTLASERLRQKQIGLSYLGRARPKIIMIMRGGAYVTGA